MNKEDAIPPFDPVKPIPAKWKPAAPPYADENPSKALVEQGMEVAEDERREAAAEKYEAQVRAETTPAESTGAIDSDDDL